MEQSRPLNQEEITKALGAETSMSVEEALGVRLDSIVPLGFLALADGFTQRQARLRAEQEQEDC